MNSNTALSLRSNWQTGAESRIAAALVLLALFVTPTFCAASELRDKRIPSLCFRRRSAESPIRRSLLKHVTASGPATYSTSKFSTSRISIAKASELTREA